MLAYCLEWLQLGVRWLHVIAGIAWIGASFYFVWLDNHLRPPSDELLKQKGVGGELWAVHGGGFYNPQKYLVAPDHLPSELHWFKWEAYTTWLSGFALLALVYYVRAPAFLIDKNIADLSVASAIGISLTSLVLALLIYETLCRSPLHRKPRLFAGVGYALLVAAIYALTHIFSGRAAYLHVGAMLGTIMAANVFTTIIPGQKRMVQAMLAGKAPNPLDGQRGKLRSVHNNYLTLPVVFIMISNHASMTYSHPQAWAVLSAIIFAGVLIRHFFNLKHKGIIQWRLIAAATMVLFGLAYAMAPSNSMGRAVVMNEQHFPTVQAILAQRCTSCHSARPTQPGILGPPAGVLLDDPQVIRANAQRIYHQTVELRAMPLGNLTSMTDAERQTLAQWFRGE